MNLLFSTDQLVLRDYSTEVLELFLPLDETSKLMTLAHMPRQILGPIEHRMISSSYLSNKIKAPSDLNKFQFLFPQAAKNLSISCNIDLIINVSMGFSHGFKKCEKTKQLTYLLDLPGDENDKNLVQKLFSSHLHKWSLKSLSNINYLWVSTPSLLKKCEQFFPNKTIELVSPFINTDDFPLIPSSYWKHDILLINAEGIGVKLMKDIISMVSLMEVKFHIIGEDSHLAEIKNAMEEHTREKIFLGERCNGELAPLMASSMGLLDLRENGFPRSALCTLSTGRPVIALNNADNNHFLMDNGILYLESKSIGNIKQAVEKLKENPKAFDSKVLRATSLRFHPLKLKSKLTRLLGFLKGTGRDHENRI